MNSRVVILLIGLMSVMANPPVTRAAHREGPLVKTDAGSLKGMSEGGVDAFLGVPYAPAPVGVLRWSAPQRIRPWRGIREAQSFGPSCYQEWPAKPFGPFTAEFIDTPKHAEDCLYLNVWKPSTGAGGLPVLFWIHGGGLAGGRAQLRSMMARTWQAAVWSLLRLTTASVHSDLWRTGN